MVFERRVGCAQLKRRTKNQTNNLTERLTSVEISRWRSGRSVTPGQVLRSCPLHWYLPMPLTARARPKCNYNGCLKFEGYTKYYSTSNNLMEAY